MIQIKVNACDFPSSDIHKAIPYGIYDTAHDKGFVNVGTDHDTASFAAASIHGWWKYVGKKYYRSLDYILITADGGGSNRYRINF